MNLARKLMMGDGAITDPYWSSVKALLHMDGANNSTTFTDEKGHAFTPVGNAVISTAQSKFGGAAYAWDGAGDCIYSTHSDFIITSSDFTIEYFAYITLTSSVREIFAIDNNALNTRINGTYLEYVCAGGIQISVVGGYTANTWQHHAVVRSGSTTTLYVNGVSIGTTAGTPTASTGGLAIGAWNSGGSESTGGYIDEVRITVGVARYSSNFTPPTAAFPGA